MFDLLIYMFENYLSSKNNLDFDNMTLELEAAGFNNKDIESALDWFTELKEMSVKIPQSHSLKLNNKLRVFTQKEKAPQRTQGLLLYKKYDLLHFLLFFQSFV